MQFTSTVSLGPFDDLFDCVVDAVYIPADPDVGMPEEWDLFVTVNGCPVTYDISKADRLRLIDEAIRHETARADEMLIDRYIDSLEG
jgi:hypothetical protein